MGLTWLALGLIPLSIAAWLVARHGFRIEPGPPRTLAAATVGWAWITVGAELLGNLGRLDPPALVAWSVGGLIVAGVIARLRPVNPVNPRFQPVERPRPGPLAIFATALVAWAALRVGLVSFLHPVKVLSDGPIYHLLDFDKSLEVSQVCEIVVSWTRFPDS